VSESERERETRRSRQRRGRWQSPKRERERESERERPEGVGREEEDGNLLLASLIIAKLVATSSIFPPAFSSCIRGLAKKKVTKTKS
jgi:hypothetical protein